MQLALPLNQPVELKTAGVAALVLTGIAFTPLPPLPQHELAAADALPGGGVRVLADAGGSTGGMALEPQGSGAGLAGGRTVSGVIADTAALAASTEKVLIDGSPVLGWEPQAGALTGDVTSRGLRTPGLVTERGNVDLSQSGTVTANIPLLDASAVKREPDSHAAGQTASEDQTAKLLAAARGWLGVPYAWGGETRRGIDCSALVQIVYRTVGIDLPRSSYEQFRMGVGIPQNSLKPGDLVFFSTNGPGASHVGIYLGDGQFISATRRQVEIQSMTLAYWQNAYRGSRRIIN